MIVEGIRHAVYKTCESEGTCTISTSNYRFGLYTVAVSFVNTLVKQETKTNIT